MFYHSTFLLKKKTYEKNTPPQECNTKPNTLKTTQKNTKKITVDSSIIF